jgi:hypothetical protein
MTDPNKLIESCRDPDGVLRFALTKHDSVAIYPPALPYCDCAEPRFDTVHTKLRQWWPAPRRVEVCCACMRPTVDEHRDTDDEEVEALARLHGVLERCMDALTLAAQGIVTALEPYAVFVRFAALSGVPEMTILRMIATNMRVTAAWKVDACYGMVDRWRAHEPWSPWLWLAAEPSVSPVNTIPALGVSHGVNVHAMVIPEALVLDVAEMHPEVGEGVERHGDTLVLVPQARDPLVSVEVAITMRPGSERPSRVIVLATEGVVQRLRAQLNPPKTYLHTMSLTMSTNLDDLDPDRFMAAFTKPLARLATNQPAPPSGVREVLFRDEGTIVERLAGYAFEFVAHGAGVFVTLPPGQGVGRHIYGTDGEERHRRWATEHPSAYEHAIAMLRGKATTDGDATAHGGRNDEPKVVIGQQIADGLGRFWVGGVDFGAGPSITVISVLMRREGEMWTLVETDSGNFAREEALERMRSLVAKKVREAQEVDLPKVLAASPFGWAYEVAAAIPAATQRLVLAGDMQDRIAVREAMDRPMTLNVPRIDTWWTEPVERVAANIFGTAPAKHFDDLRLAEVIVLIGREAAAVIESGHFLIIPRGGTPSLANKETLPVLAGAPKPALVESAEQAAGFSLDPAYAHAPGSLDGYALGMAPGERGSFHGLPMAERREAADLTIDAVPEKRWRQDIANEWKVQFKTYEAPIFVDKTTFKVVMP